MFGLASHYNENQMKLPASSIITGDVMEVLPSLPDGMTFDLVIADPPYNIGKDFGTTDDSMPIDDYAAWSVRWIDLCLARLNAGGLMYVYGFAEILSRIAVRYPVGRQRWLVWHYRNRTVPSSRFWQRSHESILCLWSSDNRPILDIDRIREPYTETFLQNAAGRKRKPTDCRYGGRDGGRTVYRAHDGGALPRDVIEVPALAGGAGASERWFMCRDCGDRVFPPAERDHHSGHETLKHPTQKPMQLSERLIMSRIAAGGRLLVPFAGSGSECLAAHRLGVSYTGIEINPLYAGFARRWIDAAGGDAEPENDLTTLLS